jgi:hypothetical protein
VCSGTQGSEIAQAEKLQREIVMILGLMGLLMEFPLIMFTFGPDEPAAFYRRFLIVPIFLPRQKVGRS